MARLWICCALLALLASTWSANIRLPSFPLAVKTPYLSVWMPGHLSHNFPTATPQFWRGQELTWIVMARIRGTTYCLLGCTGGRPGTVLAKQKSLNFTSTHTYVTLEAGSTELTMDFFSPVDPIDHVRQSLPFSYLTISASAKNGGDRPEIGLINAIDASWLSERGSPYATFYRDAEANILTLDGKDGREFSEYEQMALWGKVVVAAQTESAFSETSSCQVAGPETLFGAFIETGQLDGSVGIMDYDGYAACTSSIPASKHTSSTTFAIGLYQDNEMQYNDGKKIEYYVGYFRSRFSDLKEAVVHFLSDYENALAHSFAFDKRIVDIGKVTSSNYSDLLEFTVRQSFAGQQVMISGDTLDTSRPYSFIKEISTDGNVNTLADLIPKALPVFHVLNPEYTRMFLEPVLRFSLNAWPLNHAVHDIGKAYPNATGETPCIEEFLPLDSTSVMLWMLYLYQKTTGYTDLTEDYAGILQTYADYCVRYGLYPVLQRSSVDALGSATNQSALSVSAAIALNAYGKMTGQSNYSDVGIAFANEILEVGTDSDQTHFLTHYTDDDEAWVLMYPLAFDAWLRLDTFPSSAYKMQDDWYSRHTYPFGIQYRNNIKYTLMEWLMWVGAVSSDPLRDHLVNAVHRFLDKETGPAESVPGPTQWRVIPGPDEGIWTYFSKAKSVIGSIFMIAAVQGGYDETIVPGRKLAPLANTEEPKARDIFAQDPTLASSEGHTYWTKDFEIPFKLPAGASRRVEPSFLGLSFDTASYPLYAGNESVPNGDSVDLIRNLVTLADAYLTIRIGSSEADYSHYDPIQFTPVERINGTLSIGPSFFDGIKAFKSILRLDWIYQVPFAKHDITNSVQSTSKAMEAVPLGRLGALEIGHKPNLYAGADRPEKYGCRAYAAELFEYKSALRWNIGRIETQFQALGLSHNHIDDSWSMEECFTVGIKAQEDLRSVSMHYSHFNSSKQLRSAKKLPRHSAIVHEHKKFAPQVNYMSTIFPCHPFVITEASLVSSLDQHYREGGKKPDDTTALGVALWNLDFLLYSMSQNVSKVLMHQSCNSSTSAWTPGACHGKDSTNVNAPYSALTFVASFLRGANNFRVVRVRESDEAAVYAGYESGKLSKIAIVNYPSDSKASSASVGPVELRLPVEIASVEQRAHLSLSSLVGGAELSPAINRRSRDADQVPMKDTARSAFGFRDGVLSVAVHNGGAMLFEVR